MMKDASVFTTCVACLIVLGGFVALCGAQGGGTCGEFVYSYLVVLVVV